MDVTNPIPMITRNLKLIVLVSVLAAGLAYAFSYAFSPSYSATTKVLVRAREARFLTSTGQDLSQQPGVIDSSLAKALGQTNAGLVASRDVAERIVDDLGLDKPRPQDDSILGAIRSAFKKAYNVTRALVAHGFYTEPATPREAAILDVQNSLSATPIKDSYLLEVKANADEPALAAAIADSAAKALEQVNRARFEKDSVAYVAVLKGQVDKAKADTDAADKAIQQYKEQNNITIVAEQLKLSASSQESIRQALRQAEVDLDAATARKASIEKSLASVSDTDQSTTTVQAGRSATTTTATSPSKLYQDLQRDLADVKGQIASLTAKRDALAASLVTPSSNTGVLPAQEAKLNELELTRSSRQTAYTAIRARYDEATLNAARASDEVSQVGHASAPLYPDKPVRWMFGLLGLVLGAALGIGLAYWLERTGGLTPKAKAAPLPVQAPSGPIARGPVPESALLARKTESRP